MEDKTYGGARRISVTLRPRSSSRSNKTTRRRFTPSRNAVVVQDNSNPNPKQGHLHSSTNFPLFSSLNLIAGRSKPPIPEPKKTGGSRQRVTIGLLHSRDRRRPTPVEEDTRKIVAIDKRRSSLSVLPAKSDGTELVDKTDGSQAGQAPRSSSCTSLRGDDETNETEFFPFQSLPDDCKLKVFSFLSSHDKGRAAQVCMNWWGLMRTSGLWAHIAFSDFPFWCITTDEHNCLGNCFIRYRVRIKQFLAFLRDIRPVLRSLEFKFDIGEAADGFLQPLEMLVEKSNTTELKYASMNWKETPCRPFWADENRYRCDEVMQKHRLRQRTFCNFFDIFTKRSPKLETLVVPFDWSDKSVECLLRLKKLRSLVLEKYFVFQSLDQKLLDKLLAGLIDLRQLMMEVWTPGGHGLVFFSIVSKSVEYLDVSQSRGFYLKSVHLPKLKRFRVARHPWNGPLVLSGRLNVPCLYDVLADGAPNLEKINEHYLEPNWREFRYSMLEEVLKSVCSCRSHKSGWAM